MNLTFKRNRHLRRAGVVVQVAVMSTVIMGMGALAIDLGAMYSAMSELQVAADSAALAAAAHLGDEGADGMTPQEAAAAAAAEFAAKNYVAGQAPAVAQEDVVFGKAVLGDDGKFSFTPDPENCDSVRVTVRPGTDDGSIPMMFAGIFDFDDKALWASATAMLIPRDIAVVIDLSNSMNHDSQLRYYDRDDGGNANTRDIWCALDGPDCSRPYEPAPELETEYYLSGDTGPTIGVMSNWGDPLDPGTYNASSDPGLVYLPRGHSWNDELNPRNVLESWSEHPVDAMLQSQGYDVWERWALQTNEAEGYLTAAQTDGLGFTSRVIWKEKSTTTSRDMITVYVTSDDSESTPALSNLQIGMPIAAADLASSTAVSERGWPVEVINPDNKTGTIGIKFDSATLGEDGVSETVWVSFEVPRSVGVDDIDVVCKAGRGYSFVTHEHEDVDPWNTTRWRYRAGAVIGLAQWDSGMDGAGGDGDGMLEEDDNGDSDDEVDWIDPPIECWNWNVKDYMNFVKGHWVDGNAFRYRFGLKTFTDFILEQKPESYRTCDLWQTPQQPLRAVKDAVLTMTDVIEALDSLDKVSLEVFASDARHQVTLTDDLYQIPNTLYGRQSGHWNRCTNMGGGLAKAIWQLDEEGRGSAAKVIVLMSDGWANVDENGSYYGNVESYSWEEPCPPRDYALEQAERAADKGYNIYTVSVGYNVDRQLMEAIANIGHGQEFYAAGSPEEYTDQLEMIFRTLGGKRPVALIE